MSERKRGTGGAGGLWEAGNNALRAGKPVTAKREWKLSEEKDNWASRFADA